jgi:tetratricopeptide (TPR) repeat protein
MSGRTAIPEWKTLTIEASLLAASGGLGPAIEAGERALAAAEAELGPDHARVAAIAADLAVLHERAGAYTQAAVFYERALALRQENLGADDPAMAMAQENLAHLIFSSGGVKSAPARGGSGHSRESPGGITPGSDHAR